MKKSTFWLLFAIVNLFLFGLKLYTISAVPVNIDEVMSEILASALFLIAVLGAYSLFSIYIFEEKEKAILIEKHNKNFKVTI